HLMFLILALGLASCATTSASGTMVVDGEEVDSTRVRENAQLTNRLTRASDRDAKVRITLEEGGGSRYEHFAVLPARRPVRVAFAGVEGSPEVTFVNAALRSARDTGLEVTQVAAAQLNGRQSADVVIAPGIGALAKLSGWKNAAERGAGLFILGADEALDLEPDSLRMMGLGTVRFEGVVEAPQSGARIVVAPGVHTYTSSLGVGAFAGSPIWRYRKVAVNANHSVIARFSNGAPAIFEVTRALGRTIYLATGAGREWGQLGVDPAFAPLVVEFVKSLALAAPRPRSYDAGAFVDFGALWRSEIGGAAAPSLVLEHPDGRIQQLMPTRLVARLDSAGFYTLRSKEIEAGARVRRVVLAANPPVREAESAFLTADDVLGRITRNPAMTTASGRVVAGPSAPNDRPWSMRLLMVALVLFCIETVMGNWLTIRRAT
ncbi:MAG: hypothetical protein HOI95_10295, partial [Chromatiales bacterium]|nr:hypothetical protein [Chromatiales bacterium]